MLTNKDIRVENGNIVLNGDKYPLDGQSPEAIMQIVKDNSDTTPTEGSTNPVTSGGLFSAFAGKQDNLNVIDISSSITKDNTAVAEAFAFTYGKLLYIYFKLKAGVKDQTVVITNLPRIKSYTACVIPCFFMNGEDYNKGCCCFIINDTTSSSVQFRCGITPTGTSGTSYSAVCLLE